MKRLLILLAVVGCGKTPTAPPMVCGFQPVWTRFYMTDALGVGRVDSVALSFVQVCR